MKSNCNLFILTWCLYYLQGTFYESGSYLSQGLMFLLIVVSLYYFVYANRHFRLPQVLKILNVLLGLFTLYGGFIILFGNGISYVSNHIYLKSIYMSLLPVYPFYVFTKKGELTEKVLKIWVFVFIPTAIACYYRDQREAIMRLVELRSDRTEVTLNSSYYFLAIMPLLALYKKTIIQYSIMAVCLYFVLTGMKRGAMLIGGFCLLYSMMSTLRGSKRSKKIWVLLLSIFLMGATYYVIMQLFENSDYFNARLEQTREGNASGRDVLFSTLWNYFLDSNIITFIFGHGADATLRVAGYAHNDWIEIAVNNGLLGLGLFLSFWVNMYKTYIKTHDETLKRMLGCFLLVYFIRTFFSMSYNDILIFATAALGYVLAKRDVINYKDCRI